MTDEPNPTIRTRELKTGGRLPLPPSAQSELGGAVLPLQPPGRAAARACQPTIVNTGTRDLVHLTGGEDTPDDIGHFPGIKKMAVFKPDGIELIDEGNAKTHSFLQWIAGEI